MIIASYILSLIGIILLPVAFLIINYQKENKLKPILKKYRAYTSPSKSLSIFVIVFSLISFGGSITGLILSFLQISEETSLIVSSISLLFGILWTICLYDISFDYEAIDNRYIYVYRFGKLHQYKIKDVDNYVAYQTGLIVKDKTGKKLFTISIFGCHVEDFFKVLEEVKTQENIDEEEYNQDNPINHMIGYSLEEAILLDQYGQKYRNKYLKNFARNLILKIATAIIFYGIGLLMCYLFSALDGLKFVHISFGFILLVILISNFNAREKVKKMDSHNLGMKGSSYFPEVKGHEKKIRHTLFSFMAVCMITIICGIGFIISPSDEFVDNNSLQTKTGQLTDAEEYSDQNFQKFIGISLDDEMIFYSSSLRAIAFQGDDSFLDNFAANQTITIHYKVTEYKQKSLYYDEEIPVYNFYYINIDGVTYYDETDHQAFYNYYKILCLTFSIILFVISGVAIASPLIYLPISKEKEKKETIEVF